MKRSQLNQRNSLSDPAYFEKLACLYEGGRRFKAKIGDFLFSNPTEVPSVYEERKKSAAYTGFMGPIIDFLISQLFASPFIISTKKNGSDQTPELDPFYADFKEDVDGAGTDLKDFYKKVLTTACIKGMAWVRASVPSDQGLSPASLLEYQERGLGRATLTELDPCNVLDWETDSLGGLLWVIVYKKESRRSSPGDTRGSLITETWEVIDSEKVQTYRFEYDPQKKAPSDNDEIALVGEDPHGYPRVPLVCIEVPPALWVANRIAESQILYFNLCNGLDWAIRRTCAPMPVFYLKDQESIPAMVRASGIVLGVGEDFDFKAPDPASFTMIQARIDSVRQEIFRLSHTSGLGVDNDSPAAVGRSGDSKTADAAATKVALLGFAALIKGAIEESYELVSDARGDVEIEFSIEGMEHFDLSDQTIILKNAKEAGFTKVTSDIFAIELEIKVAEQMLPDLSQEKKASIRDEIEKADRTPLAMMLGASNLPNQDASPQGPATDGASQPSPNAFDGQKQKEK